MKTWEVVAVLRTVPAKELKLLALVNELVGKNGKLDYAKVGKRQDEVNLATIEAQAYTRATATAMEALANIKAVAEGEE